MRARLVSRQARIKTGLRIGNNASLVIFYPLPITYYLLPITHPPIHPSTPFPLSHPSTHKFRV
ncbi:hypothetical protein [Chamaesiphon polymorphus]|uniref:hypothetical protein n=1 Tax=Chamaesiphon polymorphus TaxID=2107691 RepID=UPI0015E7A886|nr:hypothetical protein [Chamaesiphon polymorphus]